MIQNFLDVDISHPNNITTDSELFFLYGLISSINPKNIVELGGGSVGIFSKLFIKAQKNNPKSKLFSIDILKMNKFSENHVLLQMDINDVKPIDLDNQKIDVLFFDCHMVIPQLNFYNKMVENGLIDENTVLILHDTNLFYEPYSTRSKNEIGAFGMDYKDGYAHQWVERNLVNYFKLKGYDVFNLSTKSENHNQNFPYLFGFSVCKKFIPLPPFYLDYPE
jgi:hypothetical protein